MSEPAILSFSNKLPKASPVNTRLFLIESYPANKESQKIGERELIRSYLHLFELKFIRFIYKELKYGKKSITYT